MPLASLAEPRAGERITFADAQVQPRTVMTSPEWSGIDEHGRRYSPFTINVEREKPWHTLSGRQHFYLDHEWMLELGEGLPNYRPPLVRGDPDRRRPRRRRPARAGAALPDAALEVVDPLRVPGQPAHADAVPRRRGAVAQPARTPRRSAIADNDWVEAYNRNGVMACRATVSHRIPKGVCLMYHAKDRHLADAAHRAARQPRRHRQLGHADRDEADAHDRRLRPAQLRLQLLRPDRLAARRGRARAPARGGGRVLDDDQGPGRDGDEPRQVHRLPHLQRHLQAGVDEPARRRVRVVQQRRDPARARVPEALVGSGASGGAAGSSTAAAGCGCAPAAG